MSAMKFKLAAAVAAASILSGCAGYDQWAEDTNKKMNSGWTEMLNGKQTVDKSGMPAGFDIEVRYGKGEGSGIPGPAASKFIDKLTWTLLLQQKLQGNDYVQRQPVE